MDVFAQLDTLFSDMVMLNPIISALFVFPVLVVLMKVSQGKVRRVADVLPNRHFVYSFGSNFALIFINLFIWLSILMGINTVLDTFWESVFGVTRPAFLSGLPFWGQFMFLMLFLDFVNYWSHRLLHRPWMWGIHSLHHSDAHMNFSTTFRVHGLELFQMKLIGVVLVGWMNLPVAAYIAAIFCRTWYSMYLHSRLPFDHGRLRKIFASPNYHRWHHADDPKVYGKNLVDMFPVWDLMFGTHYDPGTCDIPSGVSDAPSDILRAQVFPVIYLGRVFAKWRAGSTRTQPRVPTSF